MQSECDGETQVRNGHPAGSGSNSKQCITSLHLNNPALSGKYTYMAVTHLLNWHSHQEVPQTQERRLDYSQSLTNDLLSCDYLLLG